MNTEVYRDVETELDQRRRWAINDALVMLRANDLEVRAIASDLEMAFDRMLRSVLGEQARLAGVSTDDPR